MIIRHTEIKLSGYDPSIPPICQLYGPIDSTVDGEHIKSQTACETAQNCTG